jgi:pyridinium-3,5-biscarboxylic acid mononucleotide synthase
MDEARLRDLLTRVKNDAVDMEQALDELRKLPFVDLGYAKVDYHRCFRQGVPEVIFCLGKSPEQICGIAGRLAENHSNILATRAGKRVYKAVREVIPNCVYHEAARLIVINPKEVTQVGSIAVVTGGTSDIPVAEEAAITAETLGNKVIRIYDVGVAGVHRLLHSFDSLFQANVVVVVAGMEGALASVVGGLVSSPVIGVPTSVGYGASFKGVSALLSMLNSCASGVSVVNIDNGFGAGYQAALINKLAVGKCDSVHGV